MNIESMTGKEFAEHIDLCLLAITPDKYIPSGEQVGAFYIKPMQCDYTGMFDKNGVYINQSSQVKSKS